MPSRLSSLLVRDGLVGVKRMEKAFQRQVIYGGSLDTIMLEMNLVPEERLTQYLALASGLPPASRDEGGAIEPSALALITAEIAAQFRAVPLSIDGEALRVLVCSPLEISELEDLADLLDRPLQPLITPEYRWHLVYATAYRVEAPARFTTLARQLVVDATPMPVGRAKSVIIEDPASSGPIHDPNRTGPLVPMPPVLPKPSDGRVVAMPAPSDDATERVEMDLDHMRVRTTTMIGIQPARAATHPPPFVSRTPTNEGLGPARPPAVPSVPPANVRNPHAPPGIKNPESAATPPSGVSSVRNVAPPMGVPALPTLTPPSGVPVSRTSTVQSSGVPSPVVDSGRAKLPARGGMRHRGSSEPIATSGRDSPLAVVRARELLATAEDRDTVFLTLLRAARARARYAGLLTVQGGAAIGRLALAEVGIDISAVQKMLIPLDLVSPFRAVVQNQQPHIGPLQSGDPSIDSMVLRLGGSMPPSALLMPIVLRDRVVAVVIAHRVHSDLKLVDVTELLPLASAAADALGRLIVRHKSAGYRAPIATAPDPELDDSQIDTKKIVRKDAEWRTPAPVERPTLPEQPPVSAKPLRRIVEVIDDIERGKEGTVDDAMAEAVERAPETLGELAKRFPGKLRVERFTVAGRALRASQYGGLLELTVRLGSAAAELLIDRMSSPQRDVRFYATLCAAELRPRNAVFTLVERLFDQDYGVREMAIEALAGYPVADLTQALAKARRAVAADDPEMVAAATSAIVQLGDVESVDELIDAIERADRGAEHVRKALIALTAQDFGLSGRKWRKWYDNAAKRHRIEWLIDGLVHKDDSIREIAINDLRRMTGEYFGYHHDLPRKERELAADRWASWWRETGMRRFVHREGDERNRPTALLPARRD
ncbi:MAG TPA: hypothetical protein VIV11_21040 [Kofleriaceae bacterium]